MAPRKKAAAPERDTPKKGQKEEQTAAPAAIEIEAVETDIAATEAPSPMAAAAAASSAPAWVDEDEDPLSGPAAVRAHMQPLWAAASTKPKRGRGNDLTDDVQAVLSRAEPLVRRTAKQRQLTAPKPLSTILFPKGGVKDLAWHPSGEVLVVATSHTIETIHCAASYTERLALHKLNCKVASLAITASGDNAIVMPEKAHVPLSVSLRTGKVTPLTFLDTRSSTTFKVATKGTKVDPIPTLMALRPGDVTKQRFAMPVASVLHLGSLADATTSQKLSLPGLIEDVIFVGDNQIAVGVENKVFFFDIRQTGRYLRHIVDEGSLKANRLCYHAGVLCVGSPSGTVNAYVGEATAPSRTFMNLSASVDLLAAGEGTAGPAMVMGSSVQTNGFRFVNTTTFTVASSFPEVAMNHGFVQSVGFNPSAAVFSIGEANRVVNYAC